MKIYTIGHSTRTIYQFLEILIDNHIACLVDVRSYPGSRMFPHFNKSSLDKYLTKYGIKYYHLPALGGRRNIKNEIHSSIKIPAFSSFAQYMMTPEFNKGLVNLKKIAQKCKTAIMCSESLWYRCHRKMISDKLVYDGWKVYHLGMGKPIQHKIWNISRLKHGKIIYDQ